MTPRKEEHQKRMTPEGHTTENVFIVIDLFYGYSKYIHLCKKRKKGGECSSTRFKACLVK